MKIEKVFINKRKKCFEIFTQRGNFHYPFSKLRLKPSRQDELTKAFVDEELGQEAFTYCLASGKQDTVPLDQVLEYNKDPEYLREMLLYKLSLQAQRLLKAHGVSKREVIRRMGASPTQFYRLINPAFYGKSIDQMIKLLAALDCPVDLIFQKAA